VEYCNYRVALWNKKRENEEMRENLIKLKGELKLVKENNESLIKRIGDNGVSRARFRDD
jgi:hypothetical protein